MRLAIRLLPLVVAACGGPTDDVDPRDTDPAGDTEAADTIVGDTVVDDTTPAPHPGEDADLVLLDAEHVFFTGAENRRSVDVEVDLPPADETYEAMELRLSLSCPQGGCDAWDRWGFVGVVVDGGTDALPEVVELSRFITPYGVGFDWTVDVTDLRPLLTGRVTLRVFIDTWVGPGSPYGAGWLVDATLAVKGGAPPRPVLAVLPVFPPTGVVYGDPARSASSQLPTRLLPLPAGAAHVALRAFVTGHGQGNADNCAEFCARDHTLTVGGTTETRSVWRDDCGTTAAPGQAGTWRYARAGWCPGAKVRAWEVEGPVAASTVEVGWDVEAWTNTCRPDAPSCTGCTLGTGCGYDGGSHTEPFHEVGAAAIVYGD